MWVAIICSFVQFVLVAGIGQFAATYTKSTAKHRRIILWGFVLASFSVFGLTSYLAYQQEQQTKDQIGNATGGDSFAYLQLYDFDAASNLARQVALVKSGKYPVFNLNMRVADLDEPEAWNVYSTTLAEIDAPAVLLPLTLKLHPTMYLRVFFTARNRQWHEDLILKHESDHYWSADTRVFDPRGAVIFNRTESVNPVWRP